MSEKDFTEEELRERAEKLCEKEKEIVEYATNCILSFLKEKNVDYSSFKNELKDTIVNNINASLMMRKMLIAFL